MITVCAFTAGQVVALLGVVPAQNRGSAPRRPPPGPAPLRRENVILHVGAIQKRKNIARLVDAFET